MIGDTIKLRGTPKAFKTSVSYGNIRTKKSNFLKDVTMDNPQPSPLLCVDAVHRADVGGLCLF